MKKLRLDLDSLRIDTFDPSPQRVAAIGTVLANNSGYPITCGANVTCASPNNTCGVSCQNGPLGGCGGTGTGGTTPNPTGFPTCNCPTGGGCVYPTAAYHSCDEMGWDTVRVSCNCLFPDTDARMCCSGAGCSGMC